MPRLLRFRDTNYSVTDDGHVFNNNTGKELKPQLRKGYKYVNIKINGKFKHVYIHIMVAELFVPNPRHLPIVNHIDTCKLNDYYGNLEWTTNIDNIKHAVINGLMNNKPGSIAGSKKCSKPVIQYNNGVKIARYESVSEAHRITGIRYNTIIKHCKMLSDNSWRWGEDNA
jgi:hypothetical protein